MLFSNILNNLRSCLKDAGEEKNEFMYRMPIIPAYISIFYVPHKAFYFWPKKR